MILKIMNKNKFMNTKESFADDAASSGHADIQDRAFTIVELVVVLATVGLLAVMVLPALASTKPNSTLFQCMNNMKQLAVAWTMYADDSSDRLVNLNTYAKDQNGNSAPIATASQGVPWRTARYCHFDP